MISKYPELEDEYRIYDVVDNTSKGAISKVISILKEQLDRMGTTDICELSDKYDPSLKYTPRSERGWDIVGFIGQR